MGVTSRPDLNCKNQILKITAGANRILALSKKT